MKNLELKAKYPNDKAFELVKQLQIDESFVLKQVDTYFDAGKNRLKLREINDSGSELIWYSRPDELNAKSSHYEIYNTGDPAGLKKILELSIGVKTIVEKARNAFIYKDCRIHIDKVRDIGEFIEFEVVMTPGRTEQEAESLMQFLINHFKIDDKDLINVSYSDLLLAQVKA